MSCAKIFVKRCFILISVVCIAWITQADAGWENERNEKELRIQRRQKNYISQEQREQAAERLKQSSPQAAAKIAEIRATLARSAAQRIAQNNNENNVLDEKQTAVIYGAAQREALAREEEAKMKRGGTNE